MAEDVCSKLEVVALGCELVDGGRHYTSRYDGVGVGMNLIICACAKMYIDLERTHC